MPDSQLERRCVTRGNLMSVPAGHFGALVRAAVNAIGLRRLAISRGAIVIQSVFLAKLFRRARAGRKQTSGTLLDTPLLDERFYRAAYPDVARQASSPREHYFTHGWREGRNPSATFNTLYYARKHLPNGELAENPLDHYIRTGGVRTGRETRPLDLGKWAALQRAIVEPHFDRSYYRSRYGTFLGDMDPLEHFIHVGASRWFNPSPEFDLRTYVLHHPHAIRSGANLFYHAIATGLFPSETLMQAHEPPADSPGSTDHQPANFGAEDRAAELQALSDYVDPEFYLRTYADVAAAGSLPVLHYANYGWREGRNPSAFFDTKYYADRYAADIPRGMNPLFHYLSVGEKAGFRPHPLGKEAWPRPVAPPEEAWGQLAPLHEPSADLVVVIPVYRGYDDTLATIFSVLTQKQQTRYSLVVVNDCSPDPDLAKKLRLLGAADLFYYVENDQNLGFVGSVNRIVEQFATSDLILLNSDTLVYGDWVDRLMAHAAADPLVATITPYSNNASICSYPNPLQKNPLKLECTLSDLDSYAATSNRLRRTDIPTGVGFCFYMRRSVIDRIGGFDRCFGRGYGEENDFCLRAIKAGYRNVLAEDVFVFHSGEVSFAEFRGEEYEPGQLALTRKHPDYPRRVQAFVAADPGRDGRLRLDLYRLARHLGPNTAILIGFAGTGGIMTHMKQLAKRLEDAGHPVIIINAEGNSLRLKVFDRDREIYTPALQEIRVEAGAELLDQFLSWLQPALIHVHSFAQAGWRATRSLMGALARHRDRLFVTLHDYNPVCHRHNLVSREGLYSAALDLERCARCLASDPDPFDKVAPKERIAVWDDFLKQARAVFAPSEDTCRRFETYFPNIGVKVRPHEEQFSELEWFQSPPPDRNVLRIATIGAIGPHKGSNLIYSLAADAKHRDLPIVFHIVGHSALPREMELVGVVETGQYQADAECVEKLKAIQPHITFFPSIWPETYCYSLSLALALGIPPVVFDLGAQAERLARAGYGLAWPAALADHPQKLNDALLALEVEELWSLRRKPRFARYPDFPSDYYGRLCDTGQVRLDHI